MKRQAFCAYIKFFHDIYLSVHCVIPMQHPRPLVGDPRVWFAIDQCVTVLVEARLAQQGQLTEEEGLLVFESIVPFLQAFFLRNYRPSRLDGTIDDNFEGNIESSEVASVTGSTDESAHQTQIFITEVSPPKFTMHVRTLSQAEVESRCGAVAGDIAEHVSEMLLMNQSSSWWNEALQESGETLVMTLLRTVVDDDRVDTIQKLIVDCRGAQKSPTKKPDPGSVVLSGEVHGNASKISATTQNPVFGFDTEQPPTWSPDPSGGNNALTIPVARTQSVLVTRSFDVHGNVIEENVRTADSAAPAYSEYDGQMHSHSGLLTEQFRHFVLTLWDMYSNSNRSFHSCYKPKPGHEHLNDGEIRNEDCFYLEVDDNEETILPCGMEYRKALKLWLHDEHDELHDGGFQTLLKYLGVLHDIIVDVGSTDDEVEDAKRNVVSTLKMLSAIMHEDRCAMS